MTAVSKGFFQFDFDFEYTEGVTTPPVFKGFAFDFGERLQEALDSGLLWVREPSEIVPFHETMFNNEHDEYEDIFVECEGEYGVHDFATIVDPDFINVGYNTYECERNRMGFLLQEWRNWFLKHCEYVGDVRDIDPDGALTSQELWESLTK